MSTLPPGARPQFSITVEFVGPATVLSVLGEIDIYTVGLFRGRIVEALDHGAQAVVIDLAGLEFTDSTGLGALIAVNRLARCSGSVLLLAAVPEQTLKVLRITAMDRVLTAYGTVDAALAALAGTGIT